jgi:hypothetical protein
MAGAGGIMDDQPASQPRISLGDGKRGSPRVEEVSDEWNLTDWCAPDRWDAMKEMPGAISVASAFCLMQKSPIDRAIYDDALPTHTYCRRDLHALVAVEDIWLPMNRVEQIKTDFIALFESTDKSTLV